MFVLKDNFKENKREYLKRGILLGVSIVILLGVVGLLIFYRPDNVKLPVLDTKEIMREASPEWEKSGKYWETYMPTPNVYEGKNEVSGIVLHHTAHEGPADRVARALCDSTNTVSCHVVIDKDGTRYVLAPPEAITWHAGYSKWGDRYRVNTFMVGIEFQGNTLVEPLTVEQIESAIEYMRPIIEKYDIKAQNIVTHQMIRDAYREANPKNRKAWPKVDITPEEYDRVKEALSTAGLLKNN